MTVSKRGNLLSFFILIFFNAQAGAQNDFRVYPYLQYPSPHAMSIIWFSEQDSSGVISYTKNDSGTETMLTSTPVPAEALTYSLWEDTTFFEGLAPAPPFKHRVRIENLEPGTTYNYTVTQGNTKFSSSFKTAPEGNSPFRFIVYGDSETEPESTGKFVDWPNPVSDSDRVYLIDQTMGYMNNLMEIRSREPDLVIIAGDLVESGGEQRDWDEFWMHNTHPEREKSLAGAVPVMPALGNHEYVSGPLIGKYDQPASEEAVSKYLTYFDVPGNKSETPEHEGHYYSFDYGPASFIVLDVCNNDTNGSIFDTNILLLGEQDSAGGSAPGFSIKSQQYKWLEARLSEAQLNRIFTFVILHHAPYSVGPHGLLPGFEEGFDRHSGIPVRILTPVFMRYGVDAILSGHDEMWERSEVTGTEIKPNGIGSEHTIHYYDVGTGGDGLRGPIDSLVNPYQKYLAHTHAPEVWEDTVLVDGGKHYGHLEVDIAEQDSNTWEAVFKPVYLLPVVDSDAGTYSGYLRKLYDDEVILIRDASEITIPIELTKLEDR